jgi:hypothetical protein
VQSFLSRLSCLTDFTCARHCGLSLEKLSGHLAAMPQHVVFLDHATVRVAAT